MSANICGRMAADRKRDLARGRDLLDPDLVVMEGGAADGCDRRGPGQRVDAATADMGLVRLDRFGNQHAAAKAVEHLDGQISLAPDVAECDNLAVDDTKRGGILGMHHHRGFSLARDRRWRFVEAGIEEAARWTGREPERMRLVRLLDNGPMIRQRRHLLPWPQTRVAEGRMRPVGLEVELLVRVRKTVEVMRGTKIGLDVAP